MHLQAIIFDLDGVLTDTSEYHYLTWQQLADEEGWRFDRQVNEHLRGIPRRASLEVILAENQVTLDENRILALLGRKDELYQVLLENLAPANLLPGALELIQELRVAGVKVALGSASKNARAILVRLGIDGLMDVIADGHSPARPKPAPDLFLWIAGQLGVPPSHCIVVEDATAGVDATLAAGMVAIGIGPAERVGHAQLRYPSLEGITWPMIQQSWQALRE